MNDVALLHPLHQQNPSVSVCEREFCVAPLEPQKNVRTRPSSASKRIKRFQGSRIYVFQETFELLLRQLRVVDALQILKKECVFGAAVLEAKQQHLSKEKHCYYARNCLSKLSLARHTLNNT
jgi:hypothetical protein